MQNAVGASPGKTGAADPPNYAAQVPAESWNGTGQPVPGAQNTTPAPEAASSPDPAYTEPAYADPSNADPAVGDPYYNDPAAGQAYLPGYLKPQPEELVYAWEAPERAFKPKKKQFFLTAGTIATLISLIFFFSGQFPLVAVVLAALFVIYMLYSIPPKDIVNQLTTYGIRNGESLYYWEELGRFWFETKMGKEVVFVEVSRFPDRLNLVVNETDKQAVTAVLSEVLLQEKPPLTPTEKAAEWLQQKIPLDLDE